MNQEFKYTDEHYEALGIALNNSNLISCGRPDQFQYYQNELSKAIANFLLIPYWEKQNKKQQKDE